MENFVQVCQGEEERKFYDADLYLRLSREEGDRTGSDSIASQRDLLMAFVSGHSEIRLHKIRTDDGYSGVNYERPAFQEMMESVRQREINCIIVKDFSRLGRNFIETGKYIEKIFPFMGVRFISVNDDYDSINPPTASDRLLIPVKNLINDAYSRDISVKIRSHLEIKRQKGQCIAPFAVYGYQKKKDDPNHLIVDEEPAAVVREIFTKRLEGYSAQAIADWLNDQGILSPMEYKLSQGSLYFSSFKRKPVAEWTAMAVSRVLKNPVYQGTLVQGKRGTPNYKVKKIVDLPKERWVSVPDSHEAIVSQEIFERVGATFLTDVRRGPHKERAYPLSGLAYCGDCGRSMIRKTNYHGKTPYIYYVCSGHKNKKGCASSHGIRDKALEEAVSALLRMCFRLMMDDRCRENLSIRLSRISRKGEKSGERIEALKREKEKYGRYKIRLYEDFGEGLVSREDYLAWERRYEEKIREADRAIDQEERIQEDWDCGQAKWRQWMERFGEGANIGELTRMLAIFFLERIWVYEGRRMGVCLRMRFTLEP